MEKNNLRPALWTKDFILVFISNLLLFFLFYMLVPVLPFYVIDNLGASESIAGIVLALYTIAALVIRPFSGFLVDTFSRKPFYLVCYGFFCVVFAGYTVAVTLFLFIVLRILHGFGFGLSTVSGSTVAVDIMPSERRGEGIGYYGMAASIAMATGPMTGLWLFKNYSFDTIFITSFCTSLIGFMCILLITPIKKMVEKPSVKPAISWDRFVLIKGIPCVVLLALTGFGYGAVSNFIGIYCEDYGFEGKAGIYFFIMSAGILLARIISAKSINKGKIIQAIYIGSILLLIAFGIFAICSNTVMLYSVALLFGASFGYLNPAFQTMLINLARHDQRGTANATYFTFWDMGIGIGIAAGGIIIDKLNFNWLFLLCAGMILLGIVYFAFVSVSYFLKNKLR